MNPLRGILIFSLVETIAVIVWAIIIGLKPTESSGTQVVGAVVLFVFYVVEHIIAFNVGKGRGLLAPIRP
jgi:hypothetical protein